MPNVLQLPRVSRVPGSLGRVIASLEAALLRDRVHATARRNAWSAVCADRESARDRREAEAVLDALGAAGAGRRPAASTPGRSSRPTP